MASPLQPYINSRIIISDTTSGISISNGRINNTVTRYLILGFMKRSSSASEPIKKKIPVRSSIYDVYQGIYNGYGLRYCGISNTFNINDDISGLVFQDMTNAESFNYMKSMDEVIFSISGSPGISGYVQNFGGIYGSEGIGAIVYQELSGIPISILIAQDV